jgi:phosphoribosylglycinamide formyltransferase 2
MVTLAGTQNLNEFELHCRAVLGLSIPEIRLEKSGASAVILSGIETISPDYSGIDLVCRNPKADVKIFGKEAARMHRRMGVVVINGDVETSSVQLQKEARRLADLIKVLPSNR